MLMLVALLNGAPQGKDGFWEDGLVPEPSRSQKITPLTVGP
jgi:hypothetical protein